MAKTYDYIITLKKSSPLVINIFCQLLILVAVAIFTYLITLRIATSHSFRGTIPLIAVTVGVIAWWISVVLKKGKNHYFRIALFLCGIGWIGISAHYGIICGVSYIILGLLEKQVKFPSELGFDKDGVVINSFPKKELEWHAIRNVIIKDNILTIDFKSNKLLQKEIQDFVSRDVETEFNFYCKAHLKEYS